MNYFFGCCGQETPLLCDPFKPPTQQLQVAISIIEKAFSSTDRELIFQIWAGVDLNTEVDNASGPISKTPINKITLINKHLGLHNHVDTFEQPKRTKVPVLKAIIICRELVVMNTHDCG